MLTCLYAWQKRRSAERVLVGAWTVCCVLVLLHAEYYLLSEAAVGGAIALSLSVCSARFGQPD
jgi:hypothetical protein